MQLLTYNISADQRQKIFQLLKELKMTKEELYEYSAEWCGCLSLSQDKCTQSQASVIIQNLITMKSKLKPGGLTSKQRHAIMQIKRQLKWKTEDLSKFMIHTVGKGDVDDLLIKEASQVITGLKNYKGI